MLPSSTVENYLKAIYQGQMALAPDVRLVPMGQVVDVLKSGNFRGYLSVEVLHKEADPDEVLPLWSSYLKSLIHPEKKD